MNKFIPKPLVIIFLGATLFVLATSCTKEGMSRGTNSNNAAISYVSFLNLAPYGDSVAMCFNGKDFPDILPSVSYSRSYMSIASGVYDIKVKAAENRDSVLAEIASTSFDSLGAYSLLLYNDAPSTALKIAKINDDFSMVTNNSSYYRFFHMSPDQQAVDLYINGVKVQSSRTVADNVGNNVFNQFQQLNTGYVEVEVRLQGTNTVVGNPLKGNLGFGQAYTFLLTENPISGGVQYKLSVISASI
jgi:hypothetical protein